MCAGDSDLLDIARSRSSVNRLRIDKAPAPRKHLDLSLAKTPAVVAENAQNNCPMSPEKQSLTASVPSVFHDSAFLVSHPSNDLGPNAATVGLQESKFLIVDDEPVVFKVVAKYLKLAGYKNCLTTSESTKAVEIIRRESPDIVLLDVEMPQVNGLDILEEIRASASTAMIPVIILTACEDQETKQKALNLGATDFLSKPVDPSDLVPRVRNALLVKGYQDHLKSYAESLEKELEQFAYVASHDLQEPLRMVTSFTQLLALHYKGKLDSEADEFINYAVDGALRLQRLILGVVQYSRIDASRKMFEPVDCQELFEHAVADLREVLKKSRAVVTCGPLPTVMGDEKQLMQVFQNLIDNAVKFRGDKQPHVHIGAKLQNNVWIFSVRDNGVGMEEKYGEVAFGIFKRLHARDNFHGKGIGLSICKKIVERHGGRIWVESQPGKGSTFYFTLPAGVDENE